MIRRARCIAVLLHLAVVALVLAVPSHAWAAVQRYAVVIGNNQGDRDETNLRYAETDAQKVYDVLRDLGDFPPENMVLLQGEDVDTVQRVLIATNDRIRSRASGRDQALFFVYYSGHADSDALHIRGDRLETDRLRQLVRGSAAEMRILMLDSCRSGALTRVKGGVQAPPFDIRLDERLAGEGVVFLTSASANEDAQESDALKGSFFTHYFVSGLVGAADSSDDGNVSLEEAYTYAYENTLRASSRTLAGTQHPTFEFDLRGRGGFTLTRVHTAGRDRAHLSFPTGRTYLLFWEGEDGGVVAEVGVRDAHRRINVKAGRYFVRARARDHLLEGKIRVEPGQDVTVQDGDLRRIEYARLARKGSEARKIAHGPVVGYQLRTPLWRDARLCHGARAGYAIEHRWLSVTPRLGFCRSGFSNDTLSATADELDLDVIVAHVFDVPIVSIGVGMGGGVSWLRQSFRTSGNAPPRNTIGGHVDIALGLSWDLPRGFYVETSIAGQVYLFAQETGSEVETTARVSGRPFVGIGKRF